MKSEAKEKMVVEIWSDVMCPWCYIGKRRFEGALSRFGNRDQIEVTWRSFQLNPDLKTDPTKNINSYLAEIKGWTLEHARQMNDRVSSLAREEGLDYHFDKAVLANSFDAHRFMQLAKKYNLGNEAEERLFRAYFTEGKNIADHSTLIQFGNEIGLHEDEVRQMLDSDRYAEEVVAEVEEAAKLGSRGVPFYVLNRRYGISGAQPSDVFLETLEQAFQDWEKED
jgi:predicted DsbA family dithiol-disulfide isomerase